jgi:hypothetical protein
MNPPKASYKKNPPEAASSLTTVNELKTYHIV